MVSTIYEKFPEATAEEEELEQKTERPSTALDVTLLVSFYFPPRDAISREDVSLENGARNHRSIFAKPHESLQVWIYIYIYILDVCMKHIKEIGNFREDRWPTFCREGKGKLGKLLNYGVVLVFRMCF